jgi:hypothetical protein
MDTRTRTARLAAGALLAATVTACTGSGGGGHGGMGGGISTPAAATTAGGTATSGGGTAATTSGPPAVRTCPSSSLTAKLVDSDGAAGTIYYTVALTNTGSATCALRGYPGVSLLDAAEGQLGAPADREPAGQPPGAPGAAGGRVELAPGAVARFTLLMIQPGVLPGCETQDTMGKAFTIQVYPPDNTVALKIAFNGTDGVQACADPAVHELKVTTVGAS